MSNKVLVVAVVAVMVVVVQKKVCRYEPKNSGKLSRKIKMSCRGTLQN